MNMLQKSARLRVNIDAYNNPAKIPSTFPLINLYPSATFVGGLHTVPQLASGDRQKLAVLRALACAIQANAA